MTQEELVLKLSKDKYSNTLSELKLEWIKFNDNNFSRTLKATTKYGFEFEILWFHNLLTIYLPNNVRIWANDIWLDRCMPHGSKLDLRSSYKNIDSGFCIPILYFNDTIIDL